MQKELEEFLCSDIKISNVSNPTHIVAFVASWCPHSQKACKYLKKYNIMPQVYAVDLEAFVEPNELNNILEENKLYKKYYNKYIYNNDIYKWKYPHIFMKDTEWHYVGGEESMKLALKF